MSLEGVAKDYFDMLGMTYEQVFGHNEGQINFIKKSLTYLELGPSTRVLDIGQGTGKPTCSMVAATGCQIFGIDISPVMVDIARKQVPQGTFTVASMLEYQPPAPFDAAYAIFCMFQFTSEEMALVGQRWGRWIKPGGYLFIGTMAAEGFEPGVFQPEVPGIGGHVVRQFLGEPCKFPVYTHDGWRELLQDAGFELVHTETTPFHPERCDKEPHYYIICRKKFE